jgi:hypothetical protein
MSVNTARVRLVTGSNITAKVGTSNGQIQASAPVTLTTKPNRLDMLDDVVEGTPINGAVLQYRSSDDKYIVDTISFENLGALDGGSF